MLALSLCALAALASPDEPEALRASFTAAHVNLGVTIGPSVTGGRSQLQPSLRVVHAMDTGRLLLTGSTFWLSEDGGTDRIKADQWLVGIEGGAALGLPIGRSRLAFIPHLGLNGTLSAGARSRSVDDVGTSAPLFKAGALVNAGALVRLVWASIFADFGGGVLGLEPIFRVRLGLGGAF